MDPTPVFPGFSGSQIKPKGVENQYHATDADGNMPTHIDGVNMVGIMPGAGQKQIGVNEMGLPIYEKRNK